MIRILAVVVLLQGCAVKTTITDPEGRVFAVKSQRNAFVTFKQGGADISVDNRGRPGFIEQIIGAVAVGDNAVRKEVAE